MLIAYLSAGPAPAQAADLPARKLVSRRHRDPRLLAELISVIRSFRPDLLQTWYVESDIVGGAVAALTGTPWVLREPSSAPFYAGRAKAWLRKTMARLGARAIVANSPGGAAYWSTHRRTRHIANGVPVATIDAVPPAALPSPTIMYAGRLEANKNVDVVIRAAALLDGVHLVICGAGPRRADLERLSHDLGIAARVRFTGYTSEIWSFMKGAGVLVSVSDFEGSPNTALEAFAAGIPTVLSDTSAHRALADQDSALFAPLHDPAATAAMIRQALEDRSAAQTRARNARRRVESMPVAGMADAYEQLYAALLAGQKAVEGEAIPLGREE